MTCLSGLLKLERRFAENEEEEEEAEVAVEDARFLVTEVLLAALLTSEIAFAICLASPVNCWNKRKIKISEKRMYAKTHT